MGYIVIVCDMFHFADDPEHEISVPGFPTQEAAIEYARRRTRSSLEALRQPGQTPEELRSLWYTFGEDCRVVGPEGVVYRASAELDAFIRHPVPSENCDYLGFYESLLPEDFALTCEWASGAVPPPHHYEYRIALRPRKAPSHSRQALYPRMQGDITFWPDYPGPRVPTWRETFAVWTREALCVYTLLLEGGFLGTAPREKGKTATAIGGETAALEVTAQGRTWHISSVQLPPQHRAFLMENLMPAIRTTVPEAIWRTLEARRQAYHHMDKGG